MLVDETGFGHERDLRLPCVPAIVPQARRVVGDWCHAARLRSERVADVQLAVTEAAANAVLQSGCTELEIRGRMGSGKLIISVTDYGSARDDAGPGLGVGIQIIRKLAEAADFEHTQAGTRLTMRFDASHG